jgi:tetratricopeptide (TPR) repeat protein
MIDSNKKRSAAEQLRFTDEQFIWRFSPNQTDPKLLEAIFVGREPLLQNVVEKIADSATSGATHHVLIYGPRGIGKSHFTALLHHRLVTAKELNESLHIAWLNEDETTTSMVQLLVRIYRSLCKWYPNEYSAKWLDEMLDQSPEEIAEVLTRRLVARFEKRKLVILVENLNLLFENLGTAGQHRLRTVLQEHPFACLIATSQQLFKAVTDRNEPFFGFFQQIPLKALTLADAQQLLVKIAQTKGQADLVQFLNTPDGRGRVRAIHDLAGGNHRVYIVLSGFVTRESLDQLVAPFQKMADDLTPYYQERLRWISPLQRQIVELLCREHSTVNPKEIARRLLLDQRSIGKQVRLLEEIGYLTSTRRGRETFYELSEPLMRLAYEVKEQSLLGMLIEFLRIWYRPEEIQELRMAGFSQTTQNYVEAAWERSQTTPDPRLKLLEQEIERAEAEGRSHELATLWEEKAAASDLPDDWSTAGYYFDEVNSDYARAIECYDKVLELNPNKASAWNNKGCALYNLDRYEEALVCFSKAIELAPESTPAWSNKGASLNHLSRHDEALICYDKAIELDPKNAVAWSNKGSTLNWLGRHQEVFWCADKATELDPRQAYARFNRSKAFFAIRRWQDGFDAIREVFTQSRLDYLGDVSAMFSLIFRLSDEDSDLQSRINTLVDIYQQAAEEHGFRRTDQDAKRSRSGNVPIGDDATKSKDSETAVRSVLPAVNPLSHLADGLVKSLAKIDADRVTAAVLERYVVAVEQRVAELSEFEIPLRLFRYGIRYLISGEESEFVELIQPERRILRQALQLPDESL